MHWFISKLRRFNRDESGVLVAEALVMLPLLIWAYLALLVYWDAYRSINTAQKAAYTVSDIISREQPSTTLTPAYITGMRNLIKFLIDTDQTVKLRVTSVTWSAAHNRYEVDWSVSPDNAATPLTTATIGTVKANIPQIADGDHAIIVESQVDYHPITNGFGWVADLNSFNWSFQDYTGENKLGPPLFEAMADPGTPDVKQDVGDMVLKQFIVTRPRIAPKLCMQGFSCS